MEGGDRPPCRHRSAPLRTVDASRRTLPQVNPDASDARSRLVTIHSSLELSDQLQSTLPDTCRTVRRVRPSIVRLIPGLTRLPIGYSPR